MRQLRRSLKKLIPRTPPRSQRSPPKSRSPQRFFPGSPVAGSPLRVFPYTPRLVSSPSPRRRTSPIANSPIFNAVGNQSPNNVGMNPLRNEKRELKIQQLRATERELYKDLTSLLISNDYITDEYLDRKRAIIRAKYPDLDIKLDVWSTIFADPVLDESLLHKKRILLARMKQLVKVIIQYTPEINPYSPSAEDHVVKKVDTTYLLDYDAEVTTLLSSINDGSGVSSHTIANLRRVLELKEEQSAFGLVQFKDKILKFQKTVDNYLNVFAPLLIEYKEKFIKVHNEKQKLVGEIDTNGLLHNGNLFLLIKVHGAATDLKDGVEVMERIKVDNDTHQILMTAPGLYNYLQQDETKYIYDNLSKIIKERPLDAVLKESIPIIKKVSDDIASRFRERVQLLREPEKLYLKKSPAPSRIDKKKGHRIVNKSYSYEFTSPGDMDVYGIKVITGDSLETTFDISDYINFKFAPTYGIHFEMHDILKLFGRLNSITLFDLSCTASIYGASENRFNKTHANFFQESPEQPLEKRSAKRSAKRSH